MKVFGAQIKAARKRKKLSQLELAQGICTQATISNLESKNQCDSLIIFSAICFRLDLSVEECMALSSEQKVSRYLDMVEKECSLHNYQRAYNLIKHYQLDEAEKNPIILAKYNYYKGITALLGPQNMADALFYLHRVGDFDKNIGLYYILSLNAFGIYYVLSNEKERAKVYYDKAICLLKNYQGEFFPSAYRIFFNSAKFYSLIEQYELGQSIAQQGIDLNKETREGYYLDFLYYELGFNKMMLGLDATDDYKTAYYLAKHLDNQKLMAVILSDEEQYQLPLNLSK